MKLRDWRRQRGLTQRELAAAAGLSQQRITDFENGRIPRQEPMAAIFLATDGAVQPNDFYDLPPLFGAGAASEAAE